MAALNVPKAVRNNPIYANCTKPKWVDRFYQVCRELGFPYETPSPESFAQAVYDYQKKTPGLDADGMLGPKTWGKLEPKTRYSLPIEEVPDWISEMPPGWKPDVPDLPQKNGITDIIDKMVAKDPHYKTTLINSGVTVASVGLGAAHNLKRLKDIKGIQVGGSVLGSVVQPVVWAIQGNTGDFSDKALWALGCIPPLTVAAGLVTIWKGRLDDKVLDQMEEVYADEPPEMKPFLFPAQTYYWDGRPSTAAQYIAGDGGVAWRHPNGLWVYAKLEKDGKEILICDYKPRRADAIVGPELPLRPVGTRFVWTKFKGHW